MAITQYLSKLKEMIPGTSEHKEMVESERAALEVMGRWASGELVYSELKNRLENNRDYYLGKMHRQFNASQTEGELKIITNVGATVVDLIVFLLSNNPPSVQAETREPTQLGQIEASVAEELVSVAFRKSSFHKKLKNSCWLLATGGFAWWYPFWNTEKEFGRRNDKFDFTLLNPFTTRVFYQDTDYEKIPYFITLKRITPEAVFEIYGVEARPDRENVYIPREITAEGLNDEKVSVFRMYDAKSIVTVIDGRVVDREDHGLDFAPIVQINNKWVVNDAHGHDDIYRFLPIAQELNMLISATSEIARDLAWPPLLEYNNALGGRKPPKLRGTRIPVRRTDKGEALEYMINPSQVEPLLKQIGQLLDLFHFVSLMPKAAAGVFEASVTSGFQAKLAMQPATLNTDSKKIDIESAIERLAKIALFLIEKHDPESLVVDENTKLTALYDLNFKVVWPDNLPIDIAREIQNLISGIDASLTSVTQAVDKYNVLMGMGSPEETKSYLKLESSDMNLAPDRALKVAQVKQALAQIDQSMNAVREKMGVSMVPEEAMPEGGNPTNDLRAMGQPLPEEQRVAPDSAGEAVTPESTGGSIVPPEGLM